MTSNMDTIRDIPEILQFDARRSLVRIPDQIDVPLTPRVRRLMDTGVFRRLAKISQLGLVSLVYPAAHHSRLEHSLGVYRMAILYLKQLVHDERFAASIRTRDAEMLIAAALLHDVGHWPFCHIIEDMGLADLPEHEQFAGRFLLDGDVAEILRRDWQTEPEEILQLLCGEAHDLRTRMLQSILSGPIDIDKMDYLQRDSLHAGVPYGRNFDQQRLIGSLRLNEAGDALAISDKGRTAAEMMVFARYVMFSEVYWHHAVRSATAMFQRAFFLVRRAVDAGVLFRQTEDEMIRHLQRAAAGGPAEVLLRGLFGATRQLYKRLAQFSYFEQRDLYQRLARRPYPWLVRCAERFAATLSRRVGRRVAPTEILFDAPPVKLEVEFNIEVYFRREDCYRLLGDVSPVVRTLAQRQFDDYVKRVRIFVHPRLAEQLRGSDAIDPVLVQIIDELDED